MLRRKETLPQGAWGAAPPDADDIIAIILHKINVIVQSNRYRIIDNNDG